MTPTLQTIPNPEGPGSHSQILWLMDWTSPVDYDEATPTEECSPDLSLGACFVPMPSIPLPSDATALVVRIKGKAWPNHRDIGPPGYCLLAVTSANPNASFNNHIFHVEEWGGGGNGELERRRVDYSRAVLPLDGTQRLVHIHRQSQGNCEIEAVVYLEGVVVSRSPASIILRGIIDALPGSLFDGIRNAFT